ncbi:MAG: trypsin-like peptidase domain-containing protein [Planctomycetes bacterium]|nr:trypsin-like peptidase domain-containing protein [Planctomycetota bacterium]
MNRTSVLAATCLALAAVGGCVPQGMSDDRMAYVEVENVIKRARDMAYPAVVRVEAHKTEYFRGQKQRIGGFGSGVIFDRHGHVLTNYHVAGRAEELSCTLFNKERVKATLVGADPWTDLAVIQLNMDEVREKGFQVEWAPFGDSDTVVEGDTVVAIGSPFGLSRSISFGIISCHDRILSEAMDLGGGLETGMFSTWLQTDAAINPGNSGGPLVNLRGEVIGINTRGGGNDLGFAVPINVAKDVVSQILERGKVLRSTIGVQFQALQDLEGFLDVSKTEGAIIASIEPDSPAENVLQPQDILLDFDGHRVAGRYPEELFDLRRAIAGTPVGQDVILKIRRGGQAMDIHLTTAELTTVRSDEVNFEKWGFVGQNITKRLATRENLKDTRGVYVTGVRPGESAYKVRLGEGDVVVQCEQTEVESVEQLQKVYDEAVKEKKPRILIKVRRGPTVKVEVLKIEYEAEPEKPQDEQPAAAEQGGEKAGQE